MFKRIDRYVLNQLFYPFFFSLLGLLVFISLSLAIQLSNLLVGQQRPLWQMFRILGLKIPDFLVFALPIAVLFGVFTALTRLIHDREILAMQVASYSLRRILWPVIVFGLIVSLLGLAVNNYLVPWANLRYRRSLNRLATGEAFPRIEENIFFRGPEGRTYYVGKYDARKKRLEDVIVFDSSGLNLIGGEKESSYPELISCEEGRIEDEEWVLSQGDLIRLDQQGRVIYTAHFQDLRIYVGEMMNQATQAGKKPEEMRLSELYDRIRELGSPNSNLRELYLAFHTKLSLPFAALVFALFGGPLSLLFLRRSQAIGVILSIVLAGGYQGMLLGGRTLVRQSQLDPWLGAWLPDLLFGTIGLLLLLLLGRVNFSNLLQNLRNYFKLFVCLFCFVSLVVVNVSVLSHESDSLTITADRVVVKEGDTIARGDVTLEYGQWKFNSQYLRASPRNGGGYSVEAEGEVKLSGVNFTAQASSLTSEIAESEGDYELVEAIMVSGRWSSQGLNCEGREIKLQVEGESVARVSIRGNGRLYYGKSELESEEIDILRKDNKWEVETRGPSSFRHPVLNLQGNEMSLVVVSVDDVLHGEKARVEQPRGKVSLTEDQIASEEPFDLYFDGEAVDVYFDEQGKFQSARMADATFTTCQCCGEVPARPYAFSAREINVIPGEIITARSLTLFGFGLPVGWTPFYFIPLDEVANRPYFPEFGYSVSRGIYSKIQLPFRISSSYYGISAFEYYSKIQGIGGGLRIISRESGGVVLGLYGLKSNRENQLAVGLSKRFSLGQKLAATARLDYLWNRGGGDEKQENQWKVSLRSQTKHDWEIIAGRTETKEEEGGPVLAVERIPEVAVTSQASISENLSGDLKGNFSYGQYREKTINETDWNGAQRASAEANLNLDLFRGGSFQGGINGGGGINRYLFASGPEGEPWRSNFNMGGTFSLIQESRLDVLYSYRRIWGTSPFSFDRLQPSNELTFRYRYSEGFFVHKAEISYDFLLPLYKRLSPFTYKVGVRTGGLQGGLQFKFGVTPPSLLSGTLDVELSGGKGQLEFHSGYDFEQQKFLKTVIEGSYEGRTFDAALKLEPDFNRGWIGPIEVNGTWKLNRNWELEVGGGYDFDSGNSLKFSYGVYRIFNSCLKIGVTGDRTGVGFSAQIVDLPSFSSHPSSPSRGFDTAG